MEILYLITRNALDENIFENNNEVCFISCFTNVVILMGLKYPGDNKWCFVSILSFYDYNKHNQEYSRKHNKKVRVNTMKL